MYNHQCYPQGTAKHFCAEDFSPRAKWFQAISILRSSRLPPQQTESDLNVPLEVCKWLGSKNNWSYITSWNIFGIAITHTWKIIPLFSRNGHLEGAEKKNRSLGDPSWNHPGWSSSCRIQVWNIESVDDGTWNHPRILFVPSKWKNPKTLYFSCMEIQWYGLCKGVYYPPQLDNIAW